MDIVERLRAYEAQDMAPSNAATIEGLMTEAANEIERLRRFANEAIDLANRTIDNSTRTFRQIKEELNGSSS